jgi:hypothetical protein
MTADLARRVRRGAAAALWWPAGMAVAALYVAVMASPRRVPDLARFIRSAEFGQLQGAAAAWLDQAWELIDAGTPWLDRVGGQVFDRCETSLQTRVFSIPRDPPRLTCKRGITVVYGLDGSLGGRLAELAAVLRAAGWGNTRSTGLDLGRKPAIWDVSWSPGTGVPLPAVLETMPPERRFPLQRFLHMRIGWASRGEWLGQMPLGPAGPPAPAATYRPVEITGTDPEQLAAQALTRHEHAIAISVQMPYYLNANVNAQPYRLRRKVLPAWESRRR